MTTEQIKEQYSMSDILDRYGIEVNRAHKAHCPFHNGDRTASLHVYTDSFYCFGCGAGGDIFDFVERFEDCSFKEAFTKLGGTHTRLSDAAVLRIDRNRRARAKRKEELDKKRDDFDRANNLSGFWSALQQKYEPFSDEWCICVNQSQRWDAEADERLESLLDLMGMERK